MNVTDLMDESKKLLNEKKYAEALEKLHQALDGITDKSTRISEQSWIQSGLGRCYFEQAMKAKNTDKVGKLFGKAVEHFQEGLRLAKADGQDNILRISAQSWLGSCYFEQAMKAKDIDKADKLFGEAVKYYNAWLKFAEKQNSIRQQINVQSRLGRCYFEQAMRAKDTDEADKLFGEAVKHYNAWLKLAEKQNSILEQVKAQSWIGGCHFEQAIRTKDTDKAGKLFKQAAALFKRQLRLAGQLEDKQICIHQQIVVQLVLGRCYIERVRRIRNTDKAEALFKKQAGKHLLAADGQLSQLRDEADDEQLSQLSDEAEKKGMEKRIRQSLRDIDYLNEEWDSYFEKKKQEILRKKDLIYY